MKTIPLTQGKEARVDDHNYAWLNQWKWCACNAGKKQEIWYALRQAPRQNGKQRKIFMHREIGALRGFAFVDHRDSTGLNNQENNLRSATSAQNSQNRRKRTGCSSRFKGVTWNKRLSNWKAYIEVNTKTLHLGYFTLEVAAALAYNKAATRYFGEFSKLNKT